jgi:hypothetical protein
MASLNNPFSLTLLRYVGRGWPIQETRFYYVDGAISATVGNTMTTNDYIGTKMKGTKEDESLAKNKSP